MSVPDRWILSRLQQTTARVTKSLDAFLFNDAASALYDFLWHDFCDWYVEIAKHVPAEQQPATRAILRHVLEQALRLLHPVMPFVTEELWQHLRPVQSSELSVTGSKTSHNSEPSTRNSIMIAPWPKPSAKLVDREAEQLFERFQAVITAIRMTRAELNVPLESRPPVRLASPQAAVRAFFETHRLLLQKLAAVGEVNVEAKRQPLRHAAAMVVDGVEVLMPLEGLIDPAKERQRLQQRLDDLTRQAAQAEARLKDRQFTTKAPAEVVEQTKTRRAELQDTAKKVSAHLAVLQGM